MTDVEFETWREVKAARIELVQATAVLEVAAHLAEVHQQHLYRRDEGGFTGWVERRLRMSKDTAYRLLHVHQRLGGESVAICETLPRSVLYLISRPSTPEPVREEVIERAEAGEQFTHAQVKEMIVKAVAEARKKDLPAFEAEIARLREEAEQREQTILNNYAGELFADPAEIQKKIDEAIAPLKRKIEEAEADAEPINCRLEEDAVELERLVKREVALREQLKVAQTPVVIPEQRYGTIVIDPPRPMKKIEREVRPNQVEFDYPTMDYEQLRAFRAMFQPLAADDVHVFMWTTQKFLPIALRLFEDYGVNYILTMVWHKPGGMQAVGLPQYNCEFILYGRIGTPKFADTKAFNCCFNAGRAEHSRKPDEFYDLIRRVTTGDRIDIFSREKREGFDQYGNEVDKFGGAS